jgi:hypothetical protein
MARWDDDTLDDEAFERRLFESAQHDFAPSDPAAAWTCFAASVRTTAAAAEPASGLHERGTSSMREPSLDRAQVAHVAASKPYIVRCLLLGALAGGSLTAAWFTQRPVPNSSSHIASSRQNATTRIESAEASATAEASSTATGGSAAPVLTQPTKASAPPSAPRGVSSKRGTRSEHLARATTRRSTQTASSSANVPGSLVTDERESASSLAEEVARLDAARAASRRGAYDETARLVASYHRDFPLGALAPDADVIAIEAVAKQGDQANLERLCTRFLRLYPADPHAARVRSLSAQ